MKAKENKNIKVGAVSPRIRLADVGANVKRCVAEAKRAADLGARVLVFPELTFSGVTCNDLYLHSSFIKRIEAGLCEFIDATADIDIMSFVSVPVKVEEDSYSCTAAVYRGTLLGLAPKMNVSTEESRYFNIPDDCGIAVSYAGFDTVIDPDMIFVAPFDEQIRISVGFAEGANLAVNSLAAEEIVGAKELRIRSVCAGSGRMGVAYVCAGAGLGESTTDAVYAAHNIIADRGEIVAEAKPFADDTLIVADVTVGDPTPDESYDSEIDAIIKKLDVPEVLCANPFLSSDADVCREECNMAIEIQAHGLAARVERSYSKTMVIGVSGGLDSTLALLVCARAADILGIDRRNIVGVTMPCFGTTKRTRSNAEKLCEALGTTLRTVDIKASVTQHLADIGHDGVTPDVTYENAQARERTQVLMDISNMTGGLVVGTGDLSELVLGWATYNGDHMSMYSVNASIPKTMIRRIVEAYSEKEKGNGEVSAILDDILATPVSPELLPPKDGEIAQCTEELVGPYELHDFFIYCILGCHLSLRETYKHAKETLGGVYDNNTIFGWLRVFMRRFISQQFKRSCLPDGPKVTSISVSPRGALRMPSDASATVWLEELDEIEKEEK
jgi:NAD+ synthase (glutamine-hydrolysing)